MRIKFEGKFYIIEIVEEKKNSAVIITAENDGTHIKYDSLDSFLCDAHSEGIENLNWEA